MEKSNFIYKDENNATMIGIVYDRSGEAELKHIHLSYGGKENEEEFLICVGKNTDMIIQIPMAAFVELKTIVESGK